MENPENKIGRIVLVGAEDEENLAIRYIGAYLKEKKHNVRIIPCSQPKDIPKALKEIISFNPHVVGISIAFQMLTLMFLELAQQVKKRIPSTHVTLGGHFPTFEYEKLLQLDYIDSVVRFEGEIPVEMLINALLNENGFENIPNLAYKDPTTNNIIETPTNTHFPNLDKLPFPLRNKTPLTRLGEKFASLVASRGCFHANCIYCCIGAFHQPKLGEKYALRSPENVSQEIQKLYHQHQVRLFQFHDDNFLLPSPQANLKRLNDLKLNLLKKDVELDKIGILIKLRPSDLNEDIIDVLQDLGTIGVFLGVENASASGLKSLGRGCSIEDITYSLELLENYDIAVTFNLLIFHPRARLSEINENIMFMRENQNKAHDFGRAEIVAGSPLETLVRRKKLIRGHWPHWDYKIEDDSVERMFHLNALTFYHDNSLYSDLSHKIIALSYRSKLIKQLYPGQSSSLLNKDTLSLIKSFNKFNLKKLMEIYYLNAESDWQNGVGEINQDMHVNYQKFSGEYQKIANHMNKLQLLEKPFKDHDLDGYLQNSSFLRKIFRI